MELTGEKWFGQHPDSGDFDELCLRLTCTFGAAPSQTLRGKKRTWNVVRTINTMKEKRNSRRRGKPTSAGRGERDEFEPKRKLFLREERAGGNNYKVFKAENDFLFPSHARRRM